MSFLGSKLKRAVANDKTLGRPKITKTTEQKITKLRKTGMGKRKIAKELGVGVGTVMQVLEAA